MRTRSGLLTCLPSPKCPQFHNSMILELLRSTRPASTGIQRASTQGLLARCSICVRSVVDLCSRVGNIADQVSHLPPLHSIIFLKQISRFVAEMLRSRRYASFNSIFVNCVFCFDSLISGAIDVRLCPFHRASLCIFTSIHRLDWK